MTAQPVDQHDSNDPEQILVRLPERERDRFLREYREAAEAAAHEVWKYKQLQELLRLWSMHAAAYSRPDYYTRREEARHGTGEYVSLDEVVARRQTR